MPSEIMKEQLKLEQAVYERFQRVGWNIYAYDGRKNILDIKYTPDLILFDKNNAIVGMIEILCHVRPQNLANRIRRIEEALKSVAIPLIIITNGYFYDIYINGKFIVQTHVCPTPETYQFLIDYPDSIKQEIKSNDAID